MSCRRACLALVTLALAGSCGGGPNAPGLQPGQQQLAIIADPVITLTQGTSVTLTIEERDGSGRVITQPLERYSWTSSDTAIVTVNAGVLTGGTEVGQAIVTLRAANGLTAERRIWVQQSADAPSSYRITLLYDANMPEAWKPFFADAAAEWERIIRGTLPAAALDGARNHCTLASGHSASPPLTGVERGTRIYIRWIPGLPPGSLPAAGAPCIQRPSPHPTSAYAEINVTHDAFAASPDQAYIAIHEMGHALGLVAVLHGASVPWLDSINSRYIGALGLEGRRRDTGSAPAFLDVRSGHWTFPGDIMTGTRHISNTTLGALMDMGYPARW